MPARAGAVLPAAREQLAADAACPAAPRATPKSEKPQTPSRISASADAGDAAVVLGHPAAAGIGLEQMADARVLAGRPHGLVLAREGRVEHVEAHAVGADHVLVAHRADDDVVHARRDSNPARPRCSTLRGRSWPSPSRSSRTPAPRKRRAQHKISAPTYNACPKCHSPRLPHRVCPMCGSYARPRGRSRARPRARPRALARLSSLQPMPITVAVDANGADLGPAEVAAGAADAAQQGVRVLLFGPAEEFGEVAEGVEVVDAPVSIAKAPDPVRASRSTPDASIVLRRARGRRGRRRRASSAAARPAPRSPPACSTSSARAGIHRPALAIPVPVPGHPVTIVDVGANVEVRPEHLVQFGFMGAALAQIVLGVERPRVGLLSIGEEATQGHAARRRGARRAARPHGRGRHASTSSATSRATRSPSGKADVVVTDGFTGNVALKLMEGVSEAMLRHDPRRRRCRRGARRPAGCCCARRCSSSATVIDPESAGGAYLLGPAPPRRRAPRALHAAAASRRRSCSPRGRSSGDVVGRTHAALEAGARAAPGAGCPDRPLRLPRHDPRRGLQRSSRRISPTSSRSILRASTSRRASRRTSRPTRWTSTRSSRSSRTPTA